MYEALLPNTQPGDQPEFYFSAQGDYGTMLTSPTGAPAETHHFQVCFVEPLFDDDFESDLGWSVVNENVLKGKWQRGDPEATLAQPEDDHTVKGTHCYVTGATGGGLSDHDLDGGPTRLVSPVIDALGQDGVFSFYAWFYHSDEGKVQPLRIHISNDDGASWTPVDAIYHDPGWHHRSYAVSDYVTPTDQMRVRFTARDQPDNSIVEALVDDFSFGTCNYAPSLWSDAYSISEATGGTVNFSLDAGTYNAFRNYLIIGGITGTTPGTPLPGGSSILPIHWDFFSTLVVTYGNTPFFQNFLGTLDGEGKASASLNLPPILGTSGIIMHFAYALNNPWDFASNSVGIEMEP